MNEWGEGPDPLELFDGIVDVVRRYRDIRQMGDVTDKQALDIMIDEHQQETNSGTCLGCQLMQPLRTL